MSAPLASDPYATAGRSRATSSATAVATAASCSAGNAPSLVAEAVAAEVDDAWPREAAQEPRVDADWSQTSTELAAGGRERAEVAVVPGSRAVERPAAAS